MRFSTFAIGTALVLSAGTAAAQERGTVEVGVFGAAGLFDKSTALSTGLGGGGRLGAFLDSRFALEVEATQLFADRTPAKLAARSGNITGRLAYTLTQMGPLSFHLGAGGGIVSASNTYLTYSANGLVGVNLALTEDVSLRVDAVSDWLSRNNWASYQQLHAGLSFYRHPIHPAPVVAMAPAPVRPPSPTPMPMRTRVDTVYRTRVDTVVRTRIETVRVTDPTPDQLILRVQFQTNKTVLLQRSRPVLDTIALAIKATPGSRWEVQGHTDSIGTVAANTLLAQGRAQSVVDYLVSKGVDRGMMTATGFGPLRPVFSNSTVYGRAQNRRVQLRRVPPPPVGEPVK